MPAEIGQLTRSGFRPPDADAVDALRAHFSAFHHVRLAHVIEPWLLDRWLTAIDAAPFKPRVHKTTEYWGGPPPANLIMDAAGDLGRMMFVVNDPTLFGVIERITQCAAIGSFKGVVYRFQAESGHSDRWHSDMDGNRLAAMTINLGREPHAGGRLQIRDQGSGVGGRGAGIREQRGLL